MVKIGFSGARAERGSVVISMKKRPPKAQTLAIFGRDLKTLTWRVWEGKTLVKTVRCGHWADFASVRNSTRCEVEAMSNR
jgi:hypothetical protein